MSILASSMCVAPRLKRSFERARQDADDRKLKAIDPAALLLGVVEVADAMANEILRALGVDRENLRSALRDRSG
jgi:ATP-dependent Clp protease ATP-binding subunit ClpA